MDCDVGYLDRFLKPRSVAIIGLSRSAVGSPVSVLTTLRDFGYAGRIFVINPAMPEIDGVAVCADLAAMPAPADLAIIVVERTRVPAMLESCANHGIPAAIIITQGFADADAEGERLQRQISGIIGRTGIRVIGPNTIGVVNSLDGFTSSFIEVSRDRQPIGQVAQSGFLMMGHHLITNEKAGYCMSVDLGNACDVGLIDILRYYEKQEAIKVIECHAEAIDDGQAFIETAARISRTKPLVVLKAGVSEMGRAAVASHTGAVAGQARVYEAAFRQAGVIQAEDAEDLRLLSKSFATYAIPKGRRVAIMSFSGGGAVLAIDALERAGLSLATLSQTTRDAIRELFPPWMETGNPLDVWIPVSRDLHHAFPRILNQILEDEGVDAVICIYCSYNLPKYDLYDSSSHIRSLAEKHRSKPVLCWSYGQDIEGMARRIESTGAAMVFPTLDGAAGAFSKLAAYGEWRANAAASTPERQSGDRRIERIVDRAASQGRSYLFAEALEILDLAGLPVAPWALVEDDAELDEKTAALHGPLCLKVVSDDIVHKSDSGGVMLGIAKGPALRDAHDALKKSVRRNLPDARLSGVLVQEMVKGGHEIIVGMIRDPSFGPCIVFGAGGVYAEILDDFAFRIAPVSHQEACAMIAETKISKILAGARGRKVSDISGLADLLVKVSQLACDNPAIGEIDLNPVFATESGPVIADARFILALDGPAPGQQAGVERVLEAS